MQDSSITAKAMRILPLFLFSRKLIVCLKGRTTEGEEYSTQEL